MKSKPPVEFVVTTRKTVRLENVSLRSVLLYGVEPQIVAGPRVLVVVIVVVDERLEVDDVCVREEVVRELLVRVSVAVWVAVLEVLVRDWLDEVRDVLVRVWLVDVDEVSDVEVAEWLVEVDDVSDVLVEVSLLVVVEGVNVKLVEVDEVSEVLVRVRLDVVSVSEVLVDVLLVVFVRDVLVCVWLVVVDVSGGVSGTGTRADPRASVVKLATVPLSIGSTTKNVMLPYGNSGMKTRPVTLVLTVATTVPFRNLISKLLPATGNSKPSFTPSLSASNQEWSCKIPNGGIGIGTKAAPEGSVVKLASGSLDPETTTKYDSPPGKPGMLNPPVELVVKFATTVPFENLISKVLSPASSSASSF